MPTDVIKQAFETYQKHQEAQTAEEIAKCRAVLRKMSDNELQSIAKTLSDLLGLLGTPLERKTIHSFLSVLGLTHVTVIAIVLLEEVYRRSEPSQTNETEHASS